MSWRDDVVTPVADEPVRAGWELLDAARAIAFTGAIELPLLPVTTVYLDRGHIYLAERAGDPDVADRLVAAGVVRPDDLARGVVVVDGQDHLGRLFDRVPTLDRTRVVLALESLTHETVTWAAGQSVRGAVSHPYRYHPSGVHLWYRAPLSPTNPGALLPPPAAGTRPVRPTRVDAPREAARPTPRSDESIAPPPASEPSEPSAPSQPPEPSEPSAPSQPPEPSEPLAAPPEPSGSPRAEAEVSDFEIHWPSGDAEIPDPSRVSPGPAAATGASPFSSAPDPATGTPSAGLERFEHFGDVFDDSDDPDSREVAIAVRRALAAIESGAAGGRPVSTVVPVLDDVPDPFDRWSGVDRRAGQEDHAADDPFGRAEAGAPRAESILPPPLPFDRHGDDERRTALRRLVDGLRGRPD